MSDLDFMVFAQNSFLLAIVAAVCMYKYSKTRDGALIWLAMGLVAWPAIMMLVWTFAVPGVTEKIQAGQPVPFPFSLIAQGKMTLPLCFIWLRDVLASLLVLPGVLCLYRKHGPKRSHV